MSSEITGGAAGKVIGKAKELIGSLMNDEALEKEGRLQRSAADAEGRADRLDDEAAVAETRAELETRRNEIAHERRVLETEVEAERAEEAAEHERRREIRAAARSEVDVKRAATLAERSARQRAAELEADGNRTRSTLEDRAQGYEDAAERLEHEADRIDPLEG